MEQRTKKQRKLNWYKNSQSGIEYKTVLFVPVTKRGGLLKELKRREEEINKYSKDRIKILEDGGIQLKNILAKKDPFPIKKCEKKVCIVCDSEEKETLQFPCNSNNLGYRLECHTCIKNGKVSIYEGETSRSARIRGGEHTKDCEKKPC